MPQGTFRIEHDEEAADVRLHLPDGARLELTALETVRLATSLLLHALALLDVEFAVAYEETKLS